MITEEVQVTDVTGADFVFEDNYALPTLSQVETFINENGHLPEIPSANEMIQNGIELGDMNMKLLQKIEELTLYLLEKDKQYEELQETSAQQTALLEQLAKKVEQLENANHD